MAPALAEVPEGRAIPIGCRSSARAGEHLVWLAVDPDAARLLRRVG